MILPISEIFTSVQGEGTWAGQLQTFIRLAGCTVGKPFPKERYMHMGVDISLEEGGGSATYFPLPIYTEACHLYDGRVMECDTDYRVKDRLSPMEIMEQLPDEVKNVCITGGEPLMHDLRTLISYLWGKFKKIHIETSGTIVPEWPFKQDVWVTVSPKQDVKIEMMHRADEIKILVDNDFKIGTKICDVSILDWAKRKPVFIQPVSFENTINKENLRRCMEIQQQYPVLRLSCQLHKLFGVTIGELVR